MSKKPDPEPSFGDEKPSLELIKDEIVARKDFCKQVVDNIHESMNDYEKDLKKNAGKHVKSIIRIA